MTKCPKQNIIVMMATVFVLAVPSAALAGGKGGGGHGSTGEHPQESMSLNYTHVQKTYELQKATKPKTKTEAKITHRKAGKVQRIED